MWVLKRTSCSARLSSSIDGGGENGVVAMRQLVLKRLVAEDNWDEKVNLLVKYQYRDNLHHLRRPII
jgi:hypothetical protein